MKQTTKERTEVRETQTLTLDWILNSTHVLLTAKERDPVPIKFGICYKKRLQSRETIESLFLEFE